MKKIIFLSGIIFIILLVIGSVNINETGKSHKPASEPQQPQEFLIGAFSMPMADYFNHNVGMNFNLWHNYIGMTLQTVEGKQRYIPTGWNYLPSGIFCQNDSLFTNIDLYREEVNNVIESNDSNGLYSLMQRPKFLYLFSGQSSIYQCEKLDPNAFEGFYCFETVPDNVSYLYTEYPENSGIVYGRRCIYGTHDSGYIVKDLRVKDEFTQSYGQNEMYKDGYYFYYIKPRVKIPTGLSYYTQVFQIEVYGYEGDLVLSKTIIAGDFEIGGQYFGDYKEEFRVQSEPDFLRIDGALLQKVSGETNHFDIRIKWLEECNMWIDYVKVESDIAEQLFRANNNFDIWINWEAYDIGSTDGAFRFWADEPNYNMLPCVKYVQDKIPVYNNDISILMTNYSCYSSYYGESMRYLHYKTKINSMNMPEVFSASYPLNKDARVPDVFPGYSYNPEQGMFGIPVDRITYEKELQDIYFDNSNGALIKWQENEIKYAKETNKVFYFAPQVHLFYDERGSTQYPTIQREPTNEEINAMVNIMLTYGAKGIVYFEYASSNNIGDEFYCIGLHNGPDINTGERSIRTENVYGQDKWNYVKQINQKLKIWGEHLVKFDNSESESYRYHKEGERSDLISSSYIKELISYPYGNPDLCPSQDPDYDIPDLENKRYIQVGVFKNPSENLDKYFMLVNRRCSPGNDGCAGLRRIKIKFTQNDGNFDNFNNWKLIDLSDNSTVVTFNKTIDNIINLGWFQPGEGKLYKIAPVMQEGGTFVCDEEVDSNQNFRCKSNVYTNGFNLKINNGVTINFYNNTGIFINNTQYLDIFTAEFKGYNNVNWAGLNITNSQNITIQEATFRNIINGSKAVDIQNSTDDGIIFINSCNFYLGGSSITAGGIRAISLSEENILSPVYLCSNNFYCTNTNRAIEINPMGCDGCDCYIYDNYISSQSGNCNTAIFLSNVNAAGIWDNTVSGFLYGIAGINSTLYLDNNEIASARSQAYGVFGASQSNLFLTDVGGYVAAGDNNISTTGIQGKNIKLTESNFDLDNGYNTLNITDYQNQEDKGYHIYGTIPDLGDLPPDTIFERKNCFKIDAQQTFNPAVYVVRNGSPLNCFYYLPFECQNPNLPIADEYVVSMPGGYNDTIRKYETNIQVPETEQIYHLMYKSLRFKNYDDVKIKSALLLTNYLNSIYAPDVISKLYLSSIKTDTNQTAVLQTKNFLEQLILNNPGKQELVKSAFYFIQKCKIYLEQYSSALTGLEEIINQNPYSYAGLIASWDYSATLLLMDTTLGSGGEKDIYLTGNLNISERNSDTLRIRKITKFDSYDRNVFTKNDRNRLAAVIINTNNNDRERQTEKYREIEKEVKRGNITLKEEYENMKNLKEVIKIKRPKSQPEFVDIVEKDINKVFENSSSAGNIKSLIEIPQNYSLSQNYPNPFNPITKISFALPKESKVKLIIYDMLGREVARLINNEDLPAGTYIREFNGSNLASGVYFLRLLINDGNDFSDVKKIVLLK